MVNVGDHKKGRSATVISQYESTVGRPDLGPHRREGDGQHGLDNSQSGRPETETARSGKDACQKYKGAPIQVLEICCRSAKNAAAFRQMGVDALGVDRASNRHRTQAPWLKVDFTTKHGQDTIWKMLGDGTTVAFVWFGLASGTFSRARDTPLPKWVLEKGMRELKTLRSEAEPWGVGDLSSSDATRVEAENELVKFILQLMEHLNELNIPWALEQPRRSFMWSLAQGQMVKGAQVTEYQDCAYGGRRNRWHNLMFTLPALKSICKSCDGQHQHDAWGARFSGGQSAYYGSGEEAAA